MSITHEPAAFTGSYRADADHSSFGFAVRHMTVSTFRGTFADVTASLRVAGDGTLSLEGSAAVESLSVRTPAELRTHLLGDEFFDAARHPAITFASERVVLSADGAVTVEGRLTIRGITRPVVATGTYQAPVEDPYGATRTAFELSATVDRRDYGMTWNLPLPRGGDALGHEVVITANLELIAD